MLKHTLQPVRLVRTCSLNAPLRFSRAQSSSAAASQSLPTELLQVISETIRTHGPLPIARYMTLCLLHPTMGYYTNRTVFGKQGDFITSPDISQIFGELLAIWYVSQWLANAGGKGPVRIVELGPGKGTLLSDILRTFRAMPAAAAPKVSSVHLVESSAALRTTQKEVLRNFQLDSQTSWHDNVEEVAEGSEYTMVLAHEFFDALPIHKFDYTREGWREVLVDVAKAQPNPQGLVGMPKEDGLRLVLAPNATPASMMYTALDEAEGNERAVKKKANEIGSRLEVAPSAYPIAKTISKLVSGPAGGAGLIIDYGDDVPFGNSWRGFRDHKLVDPLTEPGHTDLTANVDFSYLRQAFEEHAKAFGPLDQRSFLLRLGLEPRLAGLQKGKSAEKQAELKKAAMRLVDSTGMGKQYKAMAVLPKDAPSWFPFDA